ncbi:hypothetical protein BTJ39_13850 [Izhakiella australiensis]|uniref:DUF1471 domain-containing protein n=1 Tax=Izhakiella australiensis TaxID=1926881 RepID=A0A1S8YJZ8_9GAMM|nr:hypothetical protein [Izhakiella australiensis]OON39360.1 hypothetical protein BTJ39_13850 [Izhakiella australiensis]
MKVIKAAVAIAILLSALPLTSQATESASHPFIARQATDSISATGSTSLISLTRQLEKNAQTVNCPVGNISSAGRSQPAEATGLYN